jgi:hypothetical protein
MGSLVVIHNSSCQHTLSRSWPCDQSYATVASEQRLAFRTVAHTPSRWSEASQSARLCSKRGTHTGSQLNAILVASPPHPTQDEMCYFRRGHTAGLAGCYCCRVRASACLPA